MRVGDSTNYILALLILESLEKVTIFYSARLYSRDLFLTIMPEYPLYVSLVI